MQINESAYTRQIILTIGHHIKEWAFESSSISRWSKHIVQNSHNNYNINSQRIKFEQLFHLDHIFLGENYELLCVAPTTNFPEETEQVQFLTQREIVVICLWKFSLCTRKKMAFRVCCLSVIALMLTISINCNTYAIPLTESSSESSESRSSEELAPESNSTGNGTKKDL